MNKHFATIVVTANLILIICFLGLKGWLPQAPEKVEEIVEEMKIEASRCRHCTIALDLSPGNEKLDESIDDNAKNVRFVITGLQEERAVAPRIWFETKHLRLRDLNFADVDDIYQYASKPAVAARHCWTAHRSKLETLELVKYWIETLGKYYAAPYAIEEKATGKVIGTASVTKHTSTEEPRFYFGWALDDSAYENGYELEAVRAMIEIGLVSFDAQRVAAFVRCDDDKGIEILEKAGLSREGIEPDLRRVNGQYLSCYQYALLSKEVDRKLLASSVVPKSTQATQ